MAANVEMVKEKVQAYLTEAAGTVGVDRDGDFSIQLDSARVFVRVAAHPNGEVVLINCFAYVLTGVPGTPEFFKFVATDDSLIFGTLYASEGQDGTYTLILRHMILGDYLDSEELLYAVYGVVSGANSMDDDLAARFGGKVFHQV